MKLKSLKGAIALVFSFAIAVGVLAFAPTNVFAADWSDVEDEFIHIRGHGFYYATGEGIWRRERGTGQHDHNDGFQVNVAGLRALSDGPGYVVVEGYAPGAAAGHAVLFQGITDGSFPTEIVDERFSIEIPASATAFAAPGWLWGGWSHQQRSWPVLCGEHQGQNWDFMITAIYVDGTHIFELLGGEAAVAADDEDEDEAVEEDVVEEDEDEVVEDDEDDNGYVEIEPISGEIEVENIVLVPTYRDVTLRFAVGETTYTRDNVSLPLDAAPFNADGRVMVPLRQIGEALDASFAFENNVAYVQTDAVSLALPIGEELAGGMGTPVIVEGRTFVPLGYIAQAIGATPRWDGDNNAAYIYVTVSTGFGAPPAFTPPTVGLPVEANEYDENGYEENNDAVAEEPAAGGNGMPAANGADGTGIVVATRADGGVAGAVVVAGGGTGSWPFASTTEGGDRAFTPSQGGTYRIMFNVTNEGSGGWRVRWNNSVDLFGEGVNTPADYAIVNDHSRSPDQVATVVPAHFNQGVSESGTYTLVLDVTFDGSQTAGGLIGNLALTGTAGSSDFVVNWVSVQDGNETLALWER